MSKPLLAASQTRQKQQTIQRHGQANPSPCGFAAAQATDVSPGATSTGVAKKKCFFHFFAPRKIKEIKKNQYPFLKFQIDFGPAWVRFELLLAQAVVRVDQPS